MAKVLITLVEIEYHEWNCSLSVQTSANIHLGYLAVFKCVHVLFRLAQLQFTSLAQFASGGYAKLADSHSSISRA